MTALLIVTLALWATGFVLLPRLRRCRRESGTGQPGDLSLIIPARNEAHNLPTLLRSLASQPVYRKR